MEKKLMVYTFLYRNLAIHHITHSNPTRIAENIGTVFRRRVLLSLQNRANCFIITNFLYETFRRR